MTTRRYDLVIVGLGSGGSVAAEFAAGSLGLRVATVDRIGGDCLWTGCVPSKALIASARAAHAVRRAGGFGVRTSEPEVDLDAVWDRIRAVQAEIAATDDAPERFRALGVDLIEGTARLTGPRQVTVTTATGDRVLDTRFVLLCTGSRPDVPPIEGLSAVDFLTTESIFEIARPPASLAIIGGGPIAVELSQAMVRLGVPTTMIEVAPRLLPRDEPELSDRLTSVLRTDGVDVRLATTVRRVAMDDGVVVLATDDGEVRAHGVLVATGRTANIGGLGLETLDIHAGPAGIEVDGRSRTHLPTVYAVGDVAAGRPRFTHAAANDAVVAVRDMFFPGRGTPASLVPWCTFTDPELAHVGLTASEARLRHGERSVVVHRHELAHNDRARADATTEGLLLVVTVRGRVVGAHVLAPAAGELIHELALAVRLGVTLGELAELVHIYPTLSTGIARIVADHSFSKGRRWRAFTRVGRFTG